MSKNKMENLRNHLFETIERLKDPEEETPMTCETAKEINEVAKTIVETAKIEAKLLMHFESDESQFFYPEKYKQLKGNSENA